jgi:ABC-type amino acid transport substrate-binding protein
MKYIYILLLLSSYLSATIRIGSVYDMDKSNNAVSDIAGFEKDLINLISTELTKTGENVTLVKIKQSQRVNKLKNNEVDIVLSSLSITNNRLEDIDFSNSYFENIGLSLIAKKNHEIDINDMSDSKIGYINFSTANNYINSNRLMGQEVKNIEEAISKIKHNKIDAYLGDFINLQYYQKIDEQIIILHTYPSKQKDFYAIGIQKGNQKLKKEINDILFNNMVKINVLERKWIDSDLHSSNQLSKIDPIIKNLEDAIDTLDYIVYAFVIVIIILLYVAMKNKKVMRDLQVDMDIQIKTLKKQKNEMGNLLDIISSKTSKVIELIKVDILRNDEIAKAGIDIFNTAQKEVYYIGAGGFSSDNVKWREALNKFIKNEKTKLIRIVDLPTDRENYFDDKQCVSYLMWLIQRAAALESYPRNIELYNTRAAPLWMKGYIRIFQDDKKALVFTGDHQTGNLISENISDFYNTAKNMKTAQSLTKDDILNDYFDYKSINQEKKDILDNLISYVKSNFTNPDGYEIRKKIEEYLQ